MERRAAVGITNRQTGLYIGERPVSGSIPCRHLMREMQKDARVARASGKTWDISPVQAYLGSRHTSWLSTLDTWVSTLVKHIWGPGSEDQPYLGASNALAACSLSMQLRIVLPTNNPIVPSREHDQRHLCVCRIGDYIVVIYVWWTFGSKKKTNSMVPTSSSIV